VKTVIIAVRGDGIGGTIPYIRWIDRIKPRKLPSSSL